MVKCPECGGEYKSLGNHWQHFPSHRPELTQKQLEITTGLLMGDGSINGGSKNCYLKVTMISPKYLELLDDIFASLGCGVGLKQNAAESAKNARNTGFDTNAKEQNYSDLYRLRTRLHPKFNEFREWYETGQKVWPKDIELTPTVLKHWYVGDGHYHKSGSHERIRISMSNEANNTEKVTQYFANVGLPEPSNYDEKKNNCTARWTVEDSHTLWDYMGEPLPDFEYKWPEEYR